MTGLTFYTRNPAGRPGYRKETINVKSIVPPDRMRANKIPPPKLLCECYGCQRHIARLEAMNAELAAEVDRLNRERGEGQRAA